MKWKQKRALKHGGHDDEEDVEAVPSPQQQRIDHDDDAEAQDQQQQLEEEEDDDGTSEDSQDEEKRHLEEKLRKAQRVKQHVKKVREAQQKQKQKTLAEKHADQVGQAAHVVLGALNADGKKESFTKITSHYNAFKQAISKYQTFFGEDSLKKCNELFQFIVDFDIKYSEFEENIKAKNKSALKIVSGLKRKINDDYCKVYSDSLDKFKTSGPFEVIYKKSDNDETSKTQSIKTESNDVKEEKKAQKSLPGSTVGTAEATKALNGKESDVAKNGVTSSDQTDIFFADGESSSESDEDFSLANAELIQIQDAVDDEDLIDFKTYFVKKEYLIPKSDIEETEEKDKSVQKKSKAQKSTVSASVTDANADEAQEETLEEFYFGKVESVTSDMIIEKIDEYFSMQGYKAFSFSKTLIMLEDMEELSEIYKCSLSCSVVIKLNTISLLLSSSTILGLSNLAFLDFELVLSKMDEVIKEIKNLPTGTRIDLKVPNDEINYTDDSKPIMIPMSLIQLFHDIDNEFWNLLRNNSTDSSNFEQYILILKKSRNLIDLFNTILNNLEYDFLFPAISDKTALQVRLMKHLYFMPSTFEESLSISSTILKSYNFIQKNSTNAIEKTRSLLYYIYHLCVIRQFGQAKLLMFSPSLNDIIEKGDIQTQILYNHVLTQLGICAFANGHYDEAHRYLSDILSTIRVKEMLGQDLHQIRDRSEIRKIIDSKVCVLPHLMIHQELIEFCYLVSALFSEIYDSIFAGTGHKINSAQDLLTTSLSKHLKFILLKIERQHALLGIPERISEHIYCLFRAILKYDHSSALQIINSDILHKIYLLFPNFVNVVLPNLENEIKKVCVFSFIMQTKLIYSALPLDYLVKTFDLPLEILKPLIYKCIREDFIDAFVDKDNSALVFSKTDGNDAVYHDEVNLIINKMSNLINSSEKLSETVSANII